MKSKPQPFAARAEAAGAAFFAAGGKAVPAYDKTVLALIHEAGDGSALPILNGWISGWHQANAAVPFVFDEVV